jgi:hypothetical protein
LLYARCPKPSLPVTWSQNFVFQDVSEGNPSLCCLFIDILNLLFSLYFGIEREIVS